MANGDTKTEALLNILGNGGDASAYKGCCNTKTQSYILDAIDRVQSVEDEVEELKNNPDVVDIVDTYADLQAYDTQHLTDNDIIRVLQDETHSGNSTYYRFTKNPDTWTFIGEISGGGGGGDDTQAEFVDLTITGASESGLTVRASRYSDQIPQLAQSGKDIIFRINIPQDLGLPASGVYQMPLFNYITTPTLRIYAMNMFEFNGTVYSVMFTYLPGEDEDSGTVSLTEVDSGSGASVTTFYISSTDLPPDESTPSTNVAVHKQPTNDSETYTTSEIINASEDGVIQFGVFDDVNHRLFIYSFESLSISTNNNQISGYVIDRMASYIYSINIGNDSQHPNTASIYAEYLPM